MLLYTAGPHDEGSGFSSTARLLDALLDAVAYRNRDDRCLYANPAYAKHIKCAPSQLIDRTIAETHGQAVADVLRPIVSHALLGHQVSTDLVITSISGTDLWWHVDLFPNRSHAGDVVGYFFFGRDITAAKSLSKATERHQESIRGLVESINLPMACWDRGARMMFCNSPYELWVRRPRSELIGRTLTEIFGASAWTNARPGFAEAFEGNSTVYERQVAQSTAGLRWHRIHIFPGAQGEGPIETVFTIAFDIDDDIKLRHQLAANEARIRSVVEAINLPIVRVDRALVVKYCNEPYAQFIGRAAAEIVGSPTHQLFASPAADVQKLQFERAFAGENVTYDQISISGERHHWMRVRLVGDRDAAGEIRAVYAIGYDIDSEIREREKIEAARRRLERFTENIPFPLTYIGLDGRYQYANRALLRRHALSQADVLGRHIREVRGEAVWINQEQACSAALAGQSSEIEREVLLADGSRRWTRTVFAPDQDEAGALMGVYASSFDIDEIRRAQMQLSELHAELRMHLDQSPVAVVKYDASGHIVHWSPRAEAILGYRADEMLGKQIDSKFVHPLDRASVKDVIRRIGSGGADTVINLDRYVRADGASVWIEWYNSVLRGASGEMNSVLSLGVDMTARIEAEQRLNRFGDGIPNPVTYVGSDGRYQYVNRGFTHWTGLQATQMIGKTPIEVSGELLGNLLLERINRSLAGETVSVERVSRGFDGRERWIRTHFSPDRDDTGAVIGSYNVTFDIHDAKLAEQALQRLADRDSLTDTLTRSAFFRELERRGSRPTGKALSLLFVDLDGFKEVNDTKGHAAGDELLRRVARKICELVEPSDCVGRLGGDEFVVLTHAGSPGAAQTLGERIVASIRSIELDAAGAAASVSASVGIAMLIASGNPFKGDQFVRAADKAMYVAKREGGGRVRFAE